MRSGPRPVASGLYVAALREEGAEVTVLTRFPFVYRGRRPNPRHAWRLYCREQIDGARVMRIRIPGEYWLFAPFLEAAVRSWARIRGEPVASIQSADLLDVLYGLLAIPFIAVVRPAAIVIEQGPAFLGLPVCIFARLGIPIVLQVSDVKSLHLERKRYGESSQKQIQVNRRVEEVLYRRAASVITVTESMQADIARRLGRSPEDIYLIPNGAELAAIGPADPTARQTANGVSAWRQSSSRSTPAASTASTISPRCSRPPGSCDLFLMSHSC